MTPRIVEIPLTRASAHLAAGRYSQAIGAFRTAVWVDPAVVAARLGMADALAAQGRHREAIAELIEGARAPAVATAHADAMTLYGRALELDATRVELHVPIAEAERSLGRSQQAITRVEGLAEHYMHAGRTEEAAELLRMATGWAEPTSTLPREQSAEVSSDGDTDASDDCATVIARNPLRPASPGSTRTRAPEPDALHSGGSVPDHAELDGLEQETTVARAPWPTLRPEAIREVDVTMDTRVQAPPPPPTTRRRASAKTVWIRPSPGPGALGDATRPVPETPAVAPPPRPAKLRRSATARASGA